MAHSETRNVKSRKKHRCLWCWQVIEKGEVYALTEWADGDEHGRNRFHAECREAHSVAAGYDYGILDWWYDEGCVPKFQRGHIHEPNDTHKHCKACQAEKETNQ